VAESGTLSLILKVPSESNKRIILTEQREMMVEVDNN
jgi:hypothetical protein